MRAGHKVTRVLLLPLSRIGSHSGQINTGKQETNAIRVDVLMGNIVSALVPSTASQEGTRIKISEELFVNFPMKLCNSFVKIP